MTGAYLRVNRDGRWQNIEVELLTQEEREAALSEATNLMQWLHIVCNKLSEVESFLVELENDGVIKRVS